MSRSTSDYTFHKLVIDALQSDGALCNNYEKEYNEQGTFEGGTGNRFIFKSYNDRIKNYHTILKILTGEQRANLSEALPVIDFLHPENTGFMNTYPIDDRGNLDPTTIISIPTDSNKTALDYIEEDDPYILNRALSGSNLMSHFYNTNGGFISEANVQVSPWNGEYAYRYLGILNPKVVNPLDKDDEYSSLRKSEIFAIRALDTTWIDVDFSTTTRIGSSDPKEITLDNYSTCLDATGNAFVRIISDQEMSICLDPKDICVIFPDSTYSSDTTKILIFKNNDAAAAGTSGNKESVKGGAWIPFVASLDSFSASVTPDTIEADEIIPNYLRDAFIVKYMNKYSKVDKEYYSNASGLANGIYCEPCEYTDNFDGSQTVTKWKLNNEVDYALSKGVPIEVGDKYFKGHILKRGLILDSPLQTTNEAESDYPGKATCMFDSVSKNVSGLFKSVQIDINRWQDFRLREVELVTNKADYSGERLSSAERADYLGTIDNGGTSYLSTSSMVYPDKLKTKNGKSISYDEIREIIEKCTSTKMYGNRINGDTITLDLTVDNDGVAYDIVRIDNGTILNWGLITNENGRWKSSGDIKTDYDVEYKVKFAHRHKKVLRGFWPHAEYPIDNSCAALEIDMVSPINIFSKVNNPTANVVLVYPEYNKYFPQNLFLFSRVDLGLEKFEGNSNMNLPPSQVSKGMCSFYNIEENCVISFKVEEIVKFLPSRVKYANIKEAVDPANFPSGWHNHIPCIIGAARVNPDDPSETIGDPSNDCYIYILSPMEMSLENIMVYDKDGHLINLAGEESKVSLMPMAYPNTYFPVTIKKDAEGNNICTVSEGNRKTDIKKLEGSYIIPGIPEFKDPADLRKIRHNGSGLSMGIFADLLSTGLESITSSILRQGLYQLLYKWPISTGDAGNNISNPIYLGDLKDTLQGLEELGPSLTELARSGKFTIPAEGKLITDYTNDGEKSWQGLLDLASASKGDKYKITTASGSGVAGAVYECIKQITAETKELSDSNYWQNYWGRIAQEEKTWQDFILTDEASIGDAILITTMPDNSWIPTPPPTGYSAHTFTSVICKLNYSGVELTPENWLNYWTPIPNTAELNTWQDLLNIDDAGAVTTYQIKGLDPESYTHQIYNYIGPVNNQGVATLDAPTKELADSNYWENYWKIKLGLSWSELLGISSANVNDVYYLESEDSEGEMGTYYACVLPVKQSCSEDPDSVHYWKYYWKKRPAVSRKAILLDDVDNLYKRIDYDDPTFRRLEFSYSLNNTDPDWDVKTTHIPDPEDPENPDKGYHVLTDSLQDLINRRLGLININVTEYADPHPRPSFTKLKTLLEGTFDDDAHITRDTCVELDNALGNDTRAFLNFGDPSGKDKTPDEASTLEEDLFGYIKQVIIESDHDIKDKKEETKREEIDWLKREAYEDIDADAEARYRDTTEGYILCAAGETALRNVNYYKYEYVEETESWQYIPVTIDPGKSVEGLYKYGQLGVSYWETKKYEDRVGAQGEWDVWASGIYTPYYTDENLTTINTSGSSARNVLDQIRTGAIGSTSSNTFNKILKMLASAFSAWSLGWRNLSLDDFIARYQLSSKDYTLQKKHHVLKLFGWVIPEWYTIPDVEYTRRDHHDLIKKLYDDYVKDLINTQLTQNPRPENYVVITEDEYVKSQEELYEVYQVRYECPTASGTYQLPTLGGESDQEAAESTVSFEPTATFSIDSDHVITYSSSVLPTLTYFVTILKGYTPVIPSGTIESTDAYPTYTDLTVNQIDEYIIDKNNLDYPELFVDTTVTVSGVEYDARADVLSLQINLPKYTDNDWEAITESGAQYADFLRPNCSTTERIEIPLKMVDIASGTLEGIASYIKTGLEGSGNGSGFVKYVKDQESDGIPSGRPNSLYYKRWQILNNRMNRLNGPLYQAASYLSNKTGITAPVSYQKGVVDSYKNFMEILPIEDIEPLAYMKKEAATATTVELPGKFYFQNELSALAEQISSKCILTCNKCSQQKHCPFYNEEEIIKLYCDECQTIDLWVKDNEVDLLYYSEGDVDSQGKVINRSPYLVYTDADGHTEELSHDLFKEMNLPFADIKSKVGDSNTSYNVRGLEQLRSELGERYSEFKEDSRNSLGWLLGGRWGTVSYNSFSDLENDAYPDLVLPKYKYLYDAVFLEDDLSYVSYGESLYDYPVSVTLTDNNGTKKTYTGTTKLKMPRSLKLFKNANPEWDLYLASDDTKDANSNTMLPLIYLGTIGNLQMAFDLQDDPITDEKLRDSDTKLYAKDVAQWCVNIAKGTCMNDPLDSHLDKNIDKDQYWMTSLRKSIITDGNQTWLEIDGRKREASGYQEPVLDPDNVDEALTIAGKPVVNSYQNFLRKVSIRMNDGRGNDLIPWVKEGSGLDIETQKSILPMMKTRLRLVVVKNT